uniref:Sodefrin-like factor n=1 Tax=Panagrolaimus sp. JU765 TaxID=591449 RepID=A0AC34QA18_9BILA
MEFHQLLILLTFPLISNGLKCYECFDTGPTNKNCTNDKFCTGAACLTFEDGNNVTSTAFCLLTTEHIAMNKVSPGCWLEPDGKSKHCVCFTDYCNELRDRTIPNTVPTTPAGASLSLLKHNPFLDYDYPGLDDSSSNSKPAPTNVLFPSALQEDSKTSGDDEDDHDLVPVDFQDYTNNHPDGKESNAAKTSTIYGILSVLFIPILFQRV